MESIISILPDDDNFAELVIRPNFDLSSTGCTLKQGSQITEKQLEETMLFMIRAQSFTNWALGDIGLEMDRRGMQDITRRLCKITNKSYSTISANIRVCKRVPPHFRDPRIDYTIYDIIFTSKKISETDRIDFLNELKELPKIPTASAVKVRLSQFRNKHYPETRNESGEHIHLKAFPFAPRNESGVVCPFGVVAHELGFRILDMQAGFPDCKASRLIQRGRGGTSNTYEEVFIELEFRASNFFETHRHDYRKCRLIVCWEDDVPNPPTDIEILSLRDELHVLRVKRPALFEK